MKKVTLRYTNTWDGTAKSKDSFSITDNLGGVGDGRNIENMLKLQNDEFAIEGKGNFQTLFSEVVSSVGATVQSAELNLQSAEMIRDAAENAASELSGVNMDVEKLEKFDDDKVEGSRQAPPEQVDVIF